MNTQKQTHPFPKCNVEAGGTLCGIAEISAAVPAQFPSDRGSALISLAKIIHSFRTGFRLASERYGQRRQLLEMDDRQLKDIGITRDQAEQEARKPIWKDWQWADP